MGKFLGPTIIKISLSTRKMEAELLLPILRTDSALATDVTVMNDGDSNWDDWDEDNDDELYDD